MNSLNNPEGGEVPSVIDSTAGERGLPSLKPMRKKSNVNKLWVVLVVIAALAVAAAGAAIFVKRLSERHLQERDDARTLAKQQTKDDGSGHDFGADKERLEKERSEEHTSELQS